MFLNFESKSDSAVSLGSKDDNPRTIFPLIYTSEIDFGLEKIPANSAIPAHARMK